MRNIGLRCPHCNSLTLAVKARSMSLLMKEITYMCRNPDCGFSFVARLEIARTLSVSSIPRSDIFVPLSKHIRINTMQRQLSLDLNPE